MLYLTLKTLFLRLPHVSKSSFKQTGHLFNFKAKGVMGARKAQISSFKVRVRIPYIWCYILGERGGREEGR